MLEMTLVAASPSSSAARACPSWGARCCWRGARAAAPTRTMTVLHVPPAQPFQNLQGETPLSLPWLSSSLVPLGLSWYLVLCGHSCNTCNNCTWFRASAGQGFLLANEGGRSFLLRQDNGCVAMWMKLWLYAEQVWPWGPQGRMLWDLWAGELRSRKSRCAQCWLLRFINKIL